ncbi:MAG: hypothetical protein J5I90_19850 [Caldilineales bacterium]|nr:hypothetical protein [Caldilineales bacterium]
MAIKLQNHSTAENWPGTFSWRHRRCVLSHFPYLTNLFWQICGATVYDLDHVQAHSTSLKTVATRDTNKRRTMLRLLL